jgi:hypothetical protein
MELTLVPAVEIVYRHTVWILPKPINQKGDLKWQRSMYLKK